MKQQQKTEQKTEQENFIESSQFLEMIDIEVKKFINNPCNHFIIEKAKKQNYIGSLHSKKDLVGLLGYLRMNFAMQIRILTNCSNHFAIDNRFCQFLRSEWFKNAVLKNNEIYHKLHFKDFSEFNFNSKTINYSLDS